MPHQNHEVSFASEEQTRQVDEEAEGLTQEEEELPAEPEEKGGKKPPQFVAPLDGRKLAEAVERSRRERVQ